MSRRSIARGFLLACWLQFAAPLPAQEAAPPVATAATVGERAYPYKALPIEMWVERGKERLPIDRVPELRVGDVVVVWVDVEAPELSSQNKDEQSRLRDWSVGWFLATPEGTLVFDSVRQGRTDRGRIDLARGEREIRIAVENERQKFPILLFVRTRTLESWEEIQRTRKMKASNFVDHFGRYSDVVAGYENLQAFLGALHREKPQAETLEDRLETGFQELGFTVDSKMRLDDPQVVAKLMGELETSMGKQSKTFKAEAAGKMISQMLGDQDLGLIGAAASIGGFFYRATDYQESYHWSSARLERQDQGRYWIKSAERVRYGEDEKAPDGSARQNVRSILVCTPMSTVSPRKPELAWTSDGPDSLLPKGQTGSVPEVRIVSDSLHTKTHPALVEPAISSEAQVWDSIYGFSSPLRASVSKAGLVEVHGFEKIWSAETQKVEVKVNGRWGFEPLELARFTALASLPEQNVKAIRAPYLLSQNQRYRVELESSKPIALGVARFAGKAVKLERESDGKVYLTLEPGRQEAGPTRLEVFAGEDASAHQRVLSQEYWVVSGSNFHVVWPQGSKAVQLVSDRAELAKALLGVEEIRVASAVFRRRSTDSVIFDATAPLPEEIPPGSKAEIVFREAAQGTVPNVHLETPSPPSEVTFQLYPRASNRAEGYQILLPPESGLLALGSPTEFRLRASSAWPGQTKLEMELVGPNGQKQSQKYSSSPKSGEQLLREKGALLFGEFTPTATGQLVGRLSSPVRNTELLLEWSKATEWTVVDLPRIRGVEIEQDLALLSGEDLDVTISQVFRSEKDATGVPLERRSDGAYQVSLPGLDPNEFWVTLSDDPTDRRLKVSKKR